jgi:hypothetical protein
MELSVEVTLVKKDLDDGDTQNRDVVRMELKDRIVEVLSPLLQEGWDIHITSSRIIR